MLIGPAGKPMRKERLYLIDSTTIPLYSRGSEWAKGSATRTQDLKVHVQFESGSQRLVHHIITAANVNDDPVSVRMQADRRAREQLARSLGALSRLYSSSAPTISSARAINLSTMRASAAISVELRVTSSRSACFSE